MDNMGEGRREVESSWKWGNMKKVNAENCENMENAMIDLQLYGQEIWQNKLLYNMCKAIRDLIIEVERLRQHEQI